MAGVAVGILGIGLLLQHATVFEVGRFVLFTALGVALPGFALWRVVGYYGRNLVEDLAGGFAVGTAGQIVVYLAAASDRAAGMVVGVGPDRAGAVVHRP